VTLLCSGQPGFTPHYRLDSFFLPLCPNQLQGLSRFTSDQYLLSAKQPEHEVAHSPESIKVKNALPPDTHAASWHTAYSPSHFITPKSYFHILIKSYTKLKASCCWENNLYSSYKE
jgi:hypothetical protein